jgi:hypothetical protein
MSFDVLIENKRGHAVTVYNLDGTILARIGPRESFRCSAEDPYLSLARYDRIAFTPEGVDLSVRPNWTEPERRWPVMLELKNGPAVEPRFFNGAPITLMRGIPVIVDCPPGHEWAIYDKVLLNVAEQRRVESAEHDGIYEFVPVLADQPILRSEAELERLQKEIEAMAADTVSSATVLTPEERAAADERMAGDDKEIENGNEEDRAGTE